MVLVLVQKIVPEVVLRKHLSIAEYDEAVLGSRESHVESTRVIQESDAGCLVASNAREQDEVLLSSLEAVDRCDFDFFVELRVELSMPLHVVHDESPLALVRSDDAYLIGTQACIEKGGDDLLHILRFFAVQERCSGCRYLLVAHGMVEKHRLVLLGPRKLEAFENTILL